MESTSDGGTQLMSGSSKSDITKWAPVIITVLMVGAGGIGTAAVLREDVEQLKLRVEALERARLDDREIIIELRSDVKWIRARMNEEPIGSPR